MTGAEAPGGALAGVTVLVTRPAHQAGQLVRLIEAAGGRALRFPTIEIADPENPALLDQLLARLDQFDLAVFVSPNAAHRALALMRARGALPARLRIAAVGSGTVRALNDLGCAEVLAPAGRFDSEALLELPELNDVAGKRIAIFRGAGGRGLLGETLRARGARVEYAECYRRVRPRADAGALLRRWARGELDIVTVTSAEGLQNLHELLGPGGREYLLKTPIVVVSARLAQACRALGFEHEPLVAPAASDAAVLATLKAWRARQNTL